MRCFPDDVVADEEALARVLAAAVAFTDALPPKDKKAAIRPSRMRGGPGRRES